MLTFNYDVALEVELVRARRFHVKDGYVGIKANWNEDDSDVKVAKLHGSINWTGDLRGPRPGSISAGGIRLLGPYVDNRSSVLPDYPAEVLDTACSVRGGMADQSVTMILPTRRKEFSVETSLGAEWTEFYLRMWNEADGLLEQSDRVVLIGYSMPPADEWARRLLLKRSNKSVRLEICCGDATPELEKEFRDRGFSGVRRGATTFEGFLEAARGITNAGAPPQSRNSTLSRLLALIGKQGLLPVRAADGWADEVRFTFLSAEPPSELATGEDDDDQDIQAAINRSHFLVRFDEGTLIDGSNTKTISGRDVSRIIGSY